MYVFRYQRGGTVTRLSFIESTSMSFDNVCLMLQLIDMATYARDQQDRPQLDMIFQRINDLRNRTRQTRILVDTLSRRRGLGPCSVPG
jgi:hypothetical protein